MSSGLREKLTKLGVLLLVTFPSLRLVQSADTSIYKKIFANRNDVARTGPVIRIGTPISLNPDSAHYALCTLMHNAYELFFRSYVSLHGGVLYNGTRLPIELVLVDDGSSSAVATWAALHLINEEGIKHFLGPYSSSLTRRVARRVSASSGVMVAPGASGPSVFEGRSRIFGTLPVSTYYAETSLELLAAADNGIRKSCYIITDSGTGAHARMALKYNFSVLNDTAVPSDKDPMEAARDLVDDVMRQAPDVVVASVYDLLCHAFVKRMYEVGYSPKAVVLMVCSPGDDFISAVGNAGQYILHATPWLPSMMLGGSVTGDWTSQSFADVFQRQFGAIPPYQVASAFTAAATLVRAIEEANSLDTTAIMNTLRGMRVESIFGGFDFDSNGQSTLKMKVTQYQMTSSPLLLYPCSSCGGALVYPKHDRMNIECRDTTDLATRYGFLNGTCQECPRGMESAVVNASASLQRVCRACAEGRASLLIGGSGGAQTCMSCPRGFFSGVTGARDCTACPPGRFVDATASTACKVCRVGRASPIPGKDECLVCPEGTYQNETGRSACIRCEAGKYGQLEEATGCQDCPPTLSTQGTGYTDGTACGCEAGFLIPEKWDGSRPARCEPCGRGIRCRGFGAVPELKPGYYAPAGAFNPLEGVWLCADRGACPGGLPGTCSGDLEGIACSLCPAGRSLGANYSCQQCEGGSFLAPACVLAAMLLGFAVIYYLSNGSVVKRTTVTLAGSILFGMLVTNVQLLGLLYRLNISWPAEFVRPTMQGFATLLITGSSVSLVCVLGREPMDQYLFTFVAPFALIGGFVLMALATRWLPLLSRGRLKPWTYTKCFNTLCSFVQMVFITLSGIAATAFQCYSHPNGRQSMLEYPSQVCYERGHVGIVLQGVLLLLLIVIPFITLCFWGSYSVYRETNEKGALVPQLEMYRFLIYRYQPMVWWWSNIFNCRQLLLGLVPMITPDDPSFQLAFFNVALLAYLVMLASCRPWRSPELNMLDMFTTGVLCQVTIVISGLLPATSWTGRLNTVIVVLVSGVVLALGLAVVHWLVQFGLHGRSGDFGMQYPNHPDAVSHFADEWQRLMKKLANLDPEAHRKLIRELGYYERLTIDEVMCVLWKGFDIGVGSIRTSCVGDAPPSSTKAKELRLRPSEERLKETIIHSRSLTLGGAEVLGVPSEKTLAGLSGPRPCGSSARSSCEGGAKPGGADVCGVPLERPLEVPDQLSGSRPSGTSTQGPCKGGAEPGSADVYCVPPEIPWGEEMPDQLSHLKASGASASGEGPSIWMRRGAAVESIKASSCWPPDERLIQDEKIILTF